VSDEITELRQQVKALQAEVERLKTWQDGHWCFTPSYGDYYPAAAAAPVPASVWLDFSRLPAITTVIPQATCAAAAVPQTFAYMIPAGPSH